MERIRYVNALKKSLMSISKASRKLQNDIDEISKYISEGRFIEAELSDRTINTLNSIASEYEQCRENYGNLCKAPFPEKVSDLEETLRKEEAKLQNLACIKKAKAFLGLSSVDPGISNGLSKMQMELRELLTGSVTEEQLGRYIDFVDMIKETDKGKKFEYLQKLTDKFDKDIIVAVISGMIVENDTACEDEKELVIATDLSVVEPSFVKQGQFDENKENESSDIIESDNVPGMTGIKDEDVDDATIAQMSDDKTSDEKDTDDSCNELKFAYLLQENGFNVIADSDYGEYNCEQNTAKETKDFKVSKFVNDEMGAPQMGTKHFVLSRAIKMHCVSMDMLKALSDFKTEELQYATEFLLSKGYLRKYSFHNLGEFYGYSPRCRFVVSSKMAAKFLDIRWSRVKPDISDWLDLKAVYAAPRLALLDILTILFTKKMKPKKICARESFMRNGEENTNFCVQEAIYHDSFLYYSTWSNVADLLLGCFWSTLEDADIFLKDFAEKIPELSDSERRIIIASITKEQALAAYKVLNAVAGVDMTSDNGMYFYSLLEKTFYDSTGQNAVSPDEIWSEDNVVEETEHDKDNEIEITYNEEPETENVSITPVSCEGSEEKKFSEKSGGVNETTDVSPKKEGESEDNSTGKIDEDIKGDQSGANDISRTDSVNEAGTNIKTTALSQVAYTPELETEVIRNACQMIINNKVYCATAYLKAYSLNCTELEETYLRLAYAVGDPMAQCIYRSDKIFELFSSELSFWDECLMVAASLRTFMLDYSGFDSSMPTLHTSLTNCSVVTEIRPLSELLYSLMDFKRTTHKGVDHYADYRVKNRVKTEQQLARIQREAEDIYQKYIEGAVREKKKLRRFIEAKKILFDSSNFLAEFLKIVINNDIGALSVLEDYLKDYVLRDDTAIDCVSIDPDKLGFMIDNAWNEAGENLQRNMKHVALTGSLRNNLCKSVEKIIGILCQWASCAHSLSDDTNDEGRVKYNKIRSGLVACADDAASKLQEWHTENKDIAERAGLIILNITVLELNLRLMGEYSVDRSRYFYVNFMRDNLVLLDDDYMPDFKSAFYVTDDVGVIKQIEEHAANSELMSLEDRIRYVFEGGGDDFRCARLIDEYLQERGRESVIKANHYDVEESIKRAQAESINSRDSFIENLELAQSYGRIDNTHEDQKEKILQIIDRWHEYSLRTQDFGVFSRVKRYWEQRILEEAKTRGDVLKKELNAFRDSCDDIEAVKKKIDRISQMIDQQNYTVAEDLINRLNSNEPDVDEFIIEDDYLSDFLKNYSVHYSKVSKNGHALSTLLARRQYNKEARGAARLAENWIPNGMRIGADRMRHLLITLGFAVDKVKEMQKIANGKVENYIVTLKRPSNVRKINYRHPIAIFGSIAEEKGFRVACLLGKYDANDLIERFKEMGGMQNTIVLLDYSLTMADRRRLARKIRSEMLGNVIGLIDRVLLMYLIDHYNEMRVSQMLMALMMPFAYYQPYVWESSKVMPPEMFMGRKEELDSIESPDGVNIVYGGRQLGKSAMLKMAKNDIDQNANYDRAILVDIKDKDYRGAALKISHALNDEDFFEEDVETDDWDELARAIRKRLQSKTLRPIPYFLLLLDEADAFIESCARENNYHPFDALKDIQGIGVGRFKFVIAGLRNIIRFNRQAALSNNNVLPHLSSMTVKPFQVKEARELLEMPLNYLGLRFPKGKESLVSLILASTNYFPGLIQLYCAKLIEAMTKRDYAGYNERETPVYEIREEHIKKVLADSGFTEQIREKFEITLKLGDDQYYYIIALIFAYLYHTNDYNNGYTAEDVIRIAGDFEIKKITSLSAENVSALLEELRELNILRETTSSKYLFTRYSFFQMMGQHEEVENKLMEFMGD